MCSSFTAFNLTLHLLRGRVAQIRLFRLMGRYVTAGEASRELEKLPRSLVLET